MCVGLLLSRGRCSALRLAPPPRPCFLSLISLGHGVPGSASLLQRDPFTSPPSFPSTEVLLTQHPRAPDCHRDNLWVAGKGIWVNAYFINSKGTGSLTTLTGPWRPVEGLPAIWREAEMVSAQAQLLTKWWLGDMGLSPDSCQGSRERLA